MSFPLKVLWSEGVTLDPQHFQQQDRYHEARLQLLTAAIAPYRWGVRALSWHLDGLANNLLQVETMSLIFKDGEMYSAPLPDRLPLAVDLSLLPADQQVFIFYAALPDLKPHGGNLAEPDAPRDSSRYTALELETVDLYTDAIPTGMRYLQKTVRLVPQAEARNAYDSFPVVKLRRTAKNAFEIDPAFMAASVSVAACPALTRLLRSLLEKMTAKIEVLYNLQHRPRNHIVEAHSGDTSSFWMLSTVSTASALLTHIVSVAHYRPEKLFEKMMAMTGALMALSTKFTMADLPAYAHENPGPGFVALEAILAELLDTVMSSKYFPIPLTLEQEGSRHQGQLTEIAPSTALYLAVSADMPALELVVAVPRLFKVAAPADSIIILQSSLRGIDLVYMAQMPTAVPVRPNTYYFSIDNKSELYAKMMKAQAITIFTPPIIAGLKLELFGIAV